MTRIEAMALYCEGWWAIDFTLEGHEYSTQARRLDEVVPMVTDAAVLMTGRPTDDFEVHYTVRNANYVDAVEQYKAAAQASTKASAAAAAASRRAVTLLRADGLPLRDIATLMGVTTQRVSQLARS
ncbi:MULTISPECIES: hypothetical protein [Actinomyces]|uniref:Uncharacterized protein n=1 Tax=Actinomyces glycerinitolerans TaxID=1892869 RepID=A0A1M4S0W0_9ACTO|nr:MULTISPECIES: hypothetical protein [Actinomyces]RAX21642.1 hypothetical protein DRB06_05660 [Actinomyces sp. Z5]RAX21810.1 hypothetical protein DRB07_10175 [Actinomyces sp. Z3]SHE25874.1 Hypothetical protein ACGLYG10_2111 [Actinomyces glycerinitolerans]